MVKFSVSFIWKAEYLKEDDTDTTNDRITISNIPDTTTILQGNTTTIWPLKEGKRTISIRTIDERGNTRYENKTLYLDYHKPLLSGVRINGAKLTGSCHAELVLASSLTEIPKQDQGDKPCSSSMTTSSTKPTISGQLQDLPVEIP